MSTVLALCFTISGAAALALEILWMRSAGLVFGQTAATTAAVLAAYFTGLGLGSIAARGIHRHPARIYGLLELGAAAGALWSWTVFRLLATDAGQACILSLGAFGRVGAIGAAVLPATLCFGATLPAIGQAVARDALAWRASFLYAANALGGAAGIAATGFGLPLLLGVRASYAAVAGISALAGFVAIAIAARAPQPPHVKSSATCLGTESGRGRLRAVAVGAGGLALALEILWTRLFAQVLHNSVYSFSAVALVFVVAIALGAAVAAFLMRRVHPASVAGGALAIAGVATGAGVWTFVKWTDGLAYFGMDSGLGEYLLRIVALAAATAGPAALASGAVLPALWAAWGARDTASRPLGDLTAANTFGAVGGALGAAFVALPVLGLDRSFLAAAVAYLVLADAIAPPRPRLRPVAYAALLGLVVLDPARVPLVHLRSGTETLRAAAVGPSGIATVIDGDGDRQLRLDNYYVLGGSAAEKGERRLGLVPLLVHPNPRRVAFIGGATGITASAGPALGVDETTVIELLPEVAAMARAHFGAWNGGLFERSDVRLVLDDGRRYLAASRDPFDVIVGDLFVPWHAGATNLYAREMFETVARRLSPGGLFCQWLPLYQLTRDEFEIIARTFLAVFPRASVWRGDFYAQRPVLALVGQVGERAVDLEGVRDRLERLPEWSRDPLLATASGLTMLYAGDLATARDIVPPGPLNTDDRPRIEFTAPRLTRINASGDKDWFVGGALASWYDSLDQRLADGPDSVFPASPQVGAARRAGSALYHYAVAASQHDDGTAGRYEAEVRRLVPEVVANADLAPALGGGAQGGALGELRSKQGEMRRQLETIERRLSELARSGKDVP